MFGLFSVDDSLPPTQDHILVEAVQNQVIILKTKDLAAVLEAEGRDLARMPDDARIGLLKSYERVISNFRFPYEIIVGRKSQNLDVFWEYLHQQAEAWRRRGHEQYARKLWMLSDFMQQVSLSVSPQVHQYLIVLPYDPIPATERARGKFTLTQKRLEEACQELARRCDQVVRGLARIGVPCRRLTDREIIALLHRIYHPVTGIYRTPPLARLRSFMATTEFQ